MKQSGFFRAYRRSSDRPPPASQLALLAAVVVAVLGIATVQSLKPPVIGDNSNVLLLGEEAPAGVMTIELHEQSPFGGYTRDEILEFRRAQVDRYSALMKTPYEPYPPIFRQIADRTPWFSVSGFFFDGQTNQATSGPSVLSQPILTPFELIVPTFWGLSIWTEGNLKWNKSVVSAKQLEEAKVPLTPIGGILTWNPREGRAEIVYKVTDFVRTVAPYLLAPLKPEQVDFGVSNLNARDLNLRYMYLDTTNSVAIKAPKQKSLPIETAGYLAPLTNLCPGADQCNHERNMPPELDTIEVLQLPAIASFKLWVGLPASVEETADFTYVIRIE